MSRRPGEKKDADDLETEPSKHLIHMTKTLTRTDWGGQNPQQVVQRRMQEAGFTVTSDEAQAIVDICTEQVAGCRERTKPRFNEISRRLSQLDSVRTGFSMIGSVLK